MRDAAVAAERLTKRFAGVTALDDVTFELPAGGVLGLLGPNGAGKTTAVRILATLLAPDSGQARVAGLDVVAQAASVRRLIGLSGQYAAVDPFLTGRENLVMIGLGRRAAHCHAAELLDSPTSAGTSTTAASTAANAGGRGSWPTSRPPAWYSAGTSARSGRSRPTRS